jgi:ATP-dependent protease ClpP protease subunit
MSRQTWFNIRNAASSVEIDIMDEIGAYGISTKAFIEAVRPHKNKDVTFNVDCPGGSCEDGLSIYDLIGEFTGTVSMNIIGTAASMASVIILAAKERSIAENGRVMIHRVSAGARGNADQLQAAADATRQFEERIIGIYREKLALSEEEIREKMKTEMGTWFFGEQAVAAGFATRTNAKTKARAFKAEWSPLFTMLPAALFDTAAQTTPPRISTPSPMKALLALASLVGITVKGDETEDQLTAAITAHKPQSPNVVIDFEDAAVKDAFAARITEATKDANAKIATLETELTGIKALLANGAAGAAGGNAPVKPITTTPSNSIQEQFEAITDPAERTRFYNKHRADLSKPSSYFKAA